MSYLIIAAHPDDEVLGCGGSIAKWTKAGDDVHLLIMAEGITSRDKARNIKKRKDELLILNQSLNKAGEILNVNSINLLNFPDNRMDSIDLLSIIKKIEDYVRKLKPKVIVTHHSGDLNVDHRVVYQAVITACRPQPSHPVKRIFSFEVPSATEWHSPTSNNSFIPNWFEDITVTLEQKIEALHAYESEMRKWPHPRSYEAVRHLAHWRGASVGIESAEAFEAVRVIQT